MLLHEDGQERGPGGGGAGKKGGREVGDGQALFLGWGVSFANGKLPPRTLVRPSVQAELLWAGAGGGRRPLSQPWLIPWRPWKRFHLAVSRRRERSADTVDDAVGGGCPAMDRPAWGRGFGGVRC